VCLFLPSTPSATPHFPPTHSAHINRVLAACSFQFVTSRGRVAGQESPLQNGAWARCHVPSPLASPPCRRPCFPLELSNRLRKNVSIKLGSGVGVSAGPMRSSSLECSDRSSPSRLPRYGPTICFMILLIQPFSLRSAAMGIGVCGKETPPRDAKLIKIAQSFGQIF